MIEFNRVITMIFFFFYFTVFTDNCLYGLKLFSDEITIRTGIEPVVVKNPSEAIISLHCDDSICNKDAFRIDCTDGKFTFTAKTIRGIIFAYSL